MWWGILCLVSVLILKILFDYKRPAKFPPGPRGLPIIGNILDLSKLMKETKYYNDALCRLADKYGPIVGMRLGFDKPVIIVSGKAAVTEMLSRPEFDGRSNGFVFKFRCGGSQQGLLFTDGDVWHNQKRFSLKILKQLGFGKYTMEQIIQQDAISFTNMIIELTKDGAPADISSIIGTAIVNNLWFILEGTKFDVGMTDTHVKEVINTLKTMLQESNVSGGILNQFPFLRHLFPGLTGFSRFKELQDRMNKFFTEIITKHKETKKVGVCTNFIDAYLEEIQVQKYKSPSYFTESQLIYVVKDLFNAGVETTDNTIGFVLAYLVVHQHVQTKVHDEIDKVIGKDVRPSLSDRIRLPYLNAVLAEVWRMANITGTTLPHRAMATTNLLGFEIKKDYTLIANLQSVHMDKEHWGDPEVFRPERFINQKGEFVDDPWLMPFGFGRRKCLGESVAKNTSFLFLACLFQKLHFMLPENHPTPCLRGRQSFAVKAPQMDVVVVQRY
ncbi:methyl farnesoate epoxidase [Calliopsis andreniformis]|uniref:methyl farnesoate epoxidase n=1 Tax=Calliopsis andreniformis TaxID=337506 RepID=UPI003FCDCF5B